MLNTKQQAIVGWVRSQLEFFEASNDIQSYTHYNDIEQTLETLCEDNNLSADVKLTLSIGMDYLYTGLKNS